MYESLKLFWKIGFNALAFWLCLVFTTTDLSALLAYVFAELIFSVLFLVIYILIKVSK